MIEFLYFLLAVGAVASGAMLYLFIQALRNW
jgi:hypothetical protein